jgi:hypothetical protein
MAGFGLGRTVGHRLLRALVEAGLLGRWRLVHGQPTLFVATREGIAWAGMPQVDPARVGVSTTPHWALCGRLAVILQRESRGVEVWGEPRLRAAELEAGRAVASAHFGHLPGGRSRLRRRDLVLFPSRSGGAGGGRGRAVGQGRAPARADLSHVGALPAGLGGPVLRAGACAACGFPCRFGRHAGDVIRVLPLPDALNQKEAGVARFAA